MCSPFLNITIFTKREWISLMSWLNELVSINSANVAIISNSKFLRYFSSCFFFVFLNHNLSHQSLRFPQRKTKPGTQSHVPVANPEAHNVCDDVDDSTNNCVFFCLEIRQLRSCGFFFFKCGKVSGLSFNFVFLLTVYSGLYCCFISHTSLPGFRIIIHSI